MQPRLADRPPASVGIVPRRRTRFGRSVLHPDLPPIVGAECSVMPPTQEDAVVGVRGAAPGVLDNVVQFAPPSGHPATRDDAGPVTQHDRLSLPVIEDTVRDTETVDAAVFDPNPLDRRLTTDLPGGVNREWFVYPVDHGEPTARVEVF